MAFRVIVSTSILLSVATAAADTESATRTPSLWLLCDFLDSIVPPVIPNPPSAPQAPSRPDSPRTGEEESGPECELLASEAPSLRCVTWVFFSSLGYDANLLVETMSDAEIDTLGELILLHASLSEAPPSRTRSPRR
jgi:hypothetical protein